MSLEVHIHKRGDCNIILRAPLIRYAISIATDNINYAIAKFNIIIRDLAGDILEQKGTLPTWHNGKDINVTYIDHTREDFIDDWVSEIERDTEFTEFIKIPPFD